MIDESRIRNSEITGLDGSAIDSVAASLSSSVAKSVDQAIGVALFEISGIENPMLIPNLRERARWIYQDGQPGKILEFDGKRILWIGDVTIRQDNVTDQLTMICEQPYRKLN
jgi:hypothetical protein